MNHENPRIAGNSDSEPSNPDKQSESGDFKSQAELGAMMSSSQLDFLADIDSSDTFTPARKSEIRQREQDTQMPPEQRQALDDAQERARAKLENLADEYNQSRLLLADRQRQENDRVWSRLNHPSTTVRDIEADRQTLQAQHLLANSSLQDWFHAEQGIICDARDSTIASIRGIAPPEVQQAA